QVLPQDLLLLILRERLQALDPAAGRRLPGHEWPVAADDHALSPHPVEEETQRFLAADHSVVVETALVRARRLRGAAFLGESRPAVIEPPHRVACGTAAVGDAD